MSEDIRVYDAEYLALLILSSTEDEQDLNQFLEEIRQECLKTLKRRDEE